MAPRGQRKSPINKPTPGQIHALGRHSWPKCGLLIGKPSHHCKVMRPRWNHDTNIQIWHKAVFKVGLVAEPKPTLIQHHQKYLQPFTLLGVPQAPSNKFNHLKEVKACGDGPLKLEKISSQQANTWPDPCLRQARATYRLETQPITVK